MKPEFSLLLHIRTYTYIFSLLLSIIVAVSVFSTIPESPSRYITLSKTYADIASIYLYFTLLISPITSFFRSNSWAGIALKAKKSIGISVCLFAFLHVFISFFKQFGGISGLSFLSNRYLFAFAIGACSLVILSILALTSITKIKLWLGSQLWKAIHRSVYLLGVLTLFHALLLGSRLANFNKLTAWIVLIFVSFLFLLEMKRFDMWVKNYFVKWYRISLGTLLAVFLILYAVIFMYNNPINPFSLSTHSVHEIEVKPMQERNH